MGPIVNMLEEDRATAVGKTHKKFGKVRAWSSGDILKDRQTHKHTDRQTHLSQCFATALAGEVKISSVRIKKVWTWSAATVAHLSCC